MCKGWREEPVWCQVSREPPDIENLLKLNPRIKPFANAVPSAVTKKVILQTVMFFTFNSLDPTSTDGR
jgi:hypothetical protein